MYRVMLLDEAEHDLEKLDKAVAKRVYGRIERLARNADRIRSERLTGEWARFLKLRVGDWRVIYKITGDQQLIVIHRIRHRREVYK
jgi:mRNA interferase RelE/StbE